MSLKDTIGTQLQKGADEPQEVVQDEQAEVKEAKKRAQGRPTRIHSETKLNKILTNRGMKRKDLYDAILAKYPDEPISPDAISRIVSGRRKYYSTTTLFRICGALELSPNMILDWEEELA